MNPAIFDRPSGAGALLGVGDIATPTVGYSLRYLSINYIGQPVIRVRKDVVGNPEQDFTPSQLTDGTLATFLGANDGFVSKWYDQFGSHDATQTTATEQPKIWDASTGLVTENGKPAVEFDGSDDYLVLLQSNITGTNPLVANDDILCSMVLKSLSNASAYIFNNHQGTGIYDGQHTLFHQDPDGSGITYETSYDDDVSPSTLVSTNQSLVQHLITDVRNKGGTNYKYIDGNVNVSGADTASGDVNSNVEGETSSS